MTKGPSCRDIQSSMVCVEFLFVLFTLYYYSLMFILYHLIPVCRIFICCCINLLYKFVNYLYSLHCFSLKKPSRYFL